MKQKIVVLDIDGTLTDSVALHQEAFGAAMQALALPSLNTDWASYPSHTDTGIFNHALAEHGRQADAAARAAFADDVSRRFLHQLRNTAIAPIAGAAAFLTALQASEWAVVFATGGVRGVSLAKLDALNTAYDASMVLTASEYSDRRELVAAAIRLAAERSSLAADAPIVSVGDGRWDLEVAQSLGIGFLGIGHKLPGALPDLHQAYGRLSQIAMPLTKP